MMATQPPTASEPVRVGVALFVTTNTTPRRFLMGQRLGSHGRGTWALPGGHLEYGESFNTCAARETQEETGLHIPEANLRLLTCTNTVFEKEGKHYVTVFMATELKGGEGEVRTMEPDKCAGWEWVSQRDLAEAFERQGGEVAGKTETEIGRDMPLFQPMMEVVKQLGPDRWLKEEVL